jgi:opacity protein-like surface antigen
MKNRFFIYTSVLVFSAFGATSALAEDWDFAVTPYFWMAGVDGDVKPFPAFPSTHTDMSFSDVLDDFQLGGATTFEASNGHWGFLGDFSYVDTDTGENAISADSAYDVAALETKTTWLTAAATLRVYDEPGARVDVLAGVRANWTESSVRLIDKDEGTRLDGGHDENWVDPIVGLRVIAPLGGRWSVTGYADIGGFGVGSDLTYEAYAAANYNFSNTMSIMLGYRYLSVDYDDNGFLYDVAQHGPMVGAQFRF